MLTPLYIFIIALATAFLLALFDKIHRSVSLVIFYLALGTMAVIPGYWLYQMLSAGHGGFEILTAGFKPPYSINLRFMVEEASVIALCNLTGLIAAVYLFQKFKRTAFYAQPLFIMLIMGVNGLIMTRDIFNLFVFLEIASIATYSLIGLKRDGKSLQAGFKYMIAGGLASMFLLLGIIYIYRTTGTLNLDELISGGKLSYHKAGFLPLYLIIVALLIELKPFPANGWGLDVYESAHSGLCSVIAVINSAGIFFALYKFMPLLRGQVLNLAWPGIITYFFSNLIGMKQTNVKRMLGYSSIAHMGLLLFTVMIIQTMDLENRMMYLIVGGIFLNHFLAKAGLFWITGIIKEENRSTFHYGKKLILLIASGAFVLSLIGLPPFPGFFAKWQLLILMTNSKMYLFIALVILGSLFEAVYLLKWFTKMYKNSKVSAVKVNVNQLLPVELCLAALIGTGLYLWHQLYPFNRFNWISIIPLITCVLFFILDFLPSKIKTVLAMAALSGYGYFVYSAQDNLKQIFLMIIVPGSVILLISEFNGKGQRTGYFPLLIMLLTSLVSIVVSKTALFFFISWEFMTISSYFLIMRGKKSAKPSLVYILFSLAGAFLILMAIAITANGSTNIRLIKFEDTCLTGYILLLLGILIKTGALGLHIWLPGSYAESQDSFSTVLSAILSKVGVFVLLAFMLIIGNRYMGKVDLFYIIGIIGLLTAFFAALFAVFQEDIKYLLAYSSMSQIGYIVMTIALMSHIGIVTSLYLTINHLLFKGMLFLAAAGVIYRTGTRYMYQMGGLIKRMPFSFVSVLIAIIALSGVPPLSGFGGKWLLYTSLIEQGWYLQAGLAFFASAVSFLYLFRLIHSVFLGQPKVEQLKVKEAPLVILIPQFIALMVIMAISTFPSLIMKPLHEVADWYFQYEMTIEKNNAISSLGNWDGYAVMMVTMGVFAAAFLWLFLRRKPKWVKSFNMVYAAERPSRPELTHFAYNFFAPYQKALGFLARPLATKFWYGFGEWIGSVASAFKYIYTGSIQTYSIHIILFVTILYLTFGGKP